ncbi:DNA-processing protein DprA [bacterium]|nr:DNA-processing protein DprA [bacterium]
MKIDQIVAIFNLLNVPKVGPQKVRNLVSKFNTPESIFSLSEQELCSVEGIDQKSAKAIRSFKDFEIGEKLAKETISYGISIITLWDKEYPQLLKKIYDPPVILFTIGKPLEKKEDAVAIVGTRSATQYGKRITKKLATELSSQNIVIVSGLARGIDTVAHTATVQNKQRTIAVLGSGLDIIYPSENRKLAESILENGTIVSEFPIGTKPEASNFPKRNRIISGLCHATIVVEAGNKSGAILTALNAVDQNRELFAVPGRIDDKQSLGCIRLIRNGAIPVQNGEQVIDNIKNQLYHPISPVQQKILLDLTNEEQNVLKYLSNDPIHIDLLSEKSGIGVTSLLGILLSLELKGAIMQIGGKQFVIS